MHIAIHHFNNYPEVEVIEAFCRWQRITYKTVSGACKESMTPSQGRGTPAIYAGEALIAVGFDALYAYVAANGLLLA